MEHAILISVAELPGTLHQLTKVLADHHANITYVDLIPGADQADKEVQVYFEFRLEQPPDVVIADLRRVANVRDVEMAPPLAKIYGKRVIVMGGGAQVGQVALGAIAEADRHNIRGERI